MPQEIDPETSPGRLLTYADVSAQLRISLRTSKRLVADGHLPAIRLTSRSIRVQQEDLDAYIARCREASTKEPATNSTRAS